MSGLQESDGIAMTYVLVGLAGFGLGLIAMFAIFLMVSEEVE